MIAQPRLCISNQALCLKKIHICYRPECEKSMEINVTGDSVGSVAMVENAELEAGGQREANEAMAL